MIYNHLGTEFMNETTEILRKLQLELERLLGDKLNALYLYGSHARREATPDSDIDVLVVLNDEFDYIDMIWLTSYAVSDLSLEYDTLISLVFMPHIRYESEESPFLMNIRKEAVQLQ